MTDSNSFLQRYVDLVNTNESPVSPLGLKSSSKTNLLSPSPVKSKLSSPVSLSMADKENQGYKKSFDLPQTPTKSQSLSKAFTADELRYYEFLCRVHEVKVWIESVISEELPSVTELATGDVMRDGVFLAKVTNKINPALAPSVFPAGDKLQFKHTQNINAFFSLVEHVGVPDSFRFELQDLYNKKDLPHVFETLHIMISIINKKWPGTTPDIKNVSGTMVCTKEDIQVCRRAWPRIKDFGSLANTSAVPSPKKVDIPKSEGLIQDFSSSITKDKKVNTMEQQPKTPIKPKAEGRPTYISSFKTPVSKVLDTSKTDEYMSLKDGPSAANIFAKTPSLSYSPSKMTSFSYYSPSISKYLTFDTDFYMRRSQYRDSELSHYSTYKYSPSRYSPTRKTRMNEEEFLDCVMKIQAMTKGVNIRYQIYLQNQLLSLFKEDVVGLQSLIRANSLRKMKGTKSHKWRSIEKSVDFVSLTSLIRGNRIRDKLDKKRIAVNRKESSIILFQSICHGILARRNATVLSSYVKNNTTIVTIMQGLLRGKLARNVVSHTSKDLHANIPCLTDIQATVRSILVRQCIDNRRKAFFAPSISSSLEAFQTVGRSLLQRREIQRINIELSESHKLIALLKGHSVRRRIGRCQTDLSSELEPAIGFQALVRGILVRYTLDLVDDIVEYHQIEVLQSLIRGALQRGAIKENTHHYRRNISHIIQIQSHIRMFQMKTAYQELMTYPNPSLWSVKKFVHLLNNRKSIESIQDEVETYQASLDSENMKKTKVLREIKHQLDLLDVLERQNLAKGINHGTFSKIKSKVPNSNYPGFEGLFYLLQVDPSYWKLMAAKEKEFSMRNIYSTFTTTNKKMEERERRLFMKLVSELLQQDIQECTSVGEFMAFSSPSWKLLLDEFIEKEYSEAFELFVPVLSFLGNRETDFTSDPYVLYEKFYSEAPSSQPIENQRVKNEFIKNLRNIWHAIEMIAEIFSRKTNEIPVELRYICTKTLCYFADKNICEEEALKAISMVLIESFIEHFMVNFQKFGFDQYNDENINDKIKVVIESLRIVFLQTSFDGYHKPLNQYSGEIRPHIKNLLYNLLVDLEYEQVGYAEIYNDMVSTSPVLELLSSKVIEVAQMFSDYSEDFTDLDPIQDVLKTMDFKLMSNNSGRVTLELDSSSYRFLTGDDGIRKVYDQVKRAFVIMIQVEDVETNLYDLSVSSVLPQDEPVFQELLRNNIGLEKDSFVSKLTPRTYFTLKNETLRNIQELTTAKVICMKDNKLQNFLNDIANTIKNPDYALHFVEKEVEMTNRTLVEIQNVNHKLESELRNMRSFVSSTISDIQKTSDFTPHHKGALGNLKSAYKKVQNKDSKLDGLKYKWNARQLYEKGILKRIQGENLGKHSVKVFGSSGPKFPDINFRISTTNGSRFGIQMTDKRKGPEHKHMDITDFFEFRDLLEKQAKNPKGTITLLNRKVDLNVAELLKLVTTAFYYRQSI